MAASKEEYMKTIGHIVDGSSDPTDGDAHNLTKHITKAIADGSKPDQLDISALWQACFVVAHQPTKDEAQRQDRLVKLLEMVKGQDKSDSDSGSILAKMSGLDAAMSEMWQSAPPALSTEQWTSFNAFAARITASGVADLSLYALWAFRDALEIQRPLSERNSGPGDQPPQEHEDAPLSELLPGALQWLEYCGPKLVAMTVRSHVYAKNTDVHDPGSLGKLCEDTGVAKSGFSVGRWRFWELRLKSVADAKDGAGGREKIAKLAYQGLEKMRSMDTEVRNMVEDMGRLHGSAHRNER